ncbi:hypothetical protein L1987_56713 [Smallanthus sonchifolius]|uniref:Uncharacterized protein n=1 Tax=Smallanthus sonchifolius TaxID=185202 RepID=A0ACB9ED76_9ASTR|nr:hypothetical protein L1987_56713 [Smallanthus sonchifolius]
MRILFCIIGSQFYFEWGSGEWAGPKVLSRDGWGLVGTIHTLCTKLWRDVRNSSSFGVIADVLRMFVNKNYIDDEFEVALQDFIARNILNPDFEEKFGPILGMGGVKNNYVNSLNVVKSGLLIDKGTPEVQFQSHYNHLFQAEDIQNNPDVTQLHDLDSKSDSTEDIIVFTVDSSLLTALSTRFVRNTGYEDINFYCAMTERDLTCLLKRKLLYRQKVLNNIRNCTIDDSLDLTLKEKPAEKKSRVVLKEKAESKGYLGQDGRKTFKITGSNSKGLKKVEETIVQPMGRGFAAPILSVNFNIGHKKDDPKHVHAYSADDIKILEKIQYEGS